VLAGMTISEKPFSMEELIVRIQSLLRNKAEAPKKINTGTVKMGKYDFH